MSPLEHRLRRQAMARLYLTEREPGPEPTPTGAVWQCPLVHASAAEPLTVLAERVAAAGQLWLRNFDLQPWLQLVFSHTEQPWSWVFQRALAPGQRGLAIGPLPHELIPAGPTLFGLPLRTAQTTSAWAPEFFRRHARAVR